MRQSNKTTRAALRLVALQLFAALALAAPAAGSRAPREARASGATAYGPAASRASASEASGVQRRRRRRARRDTLLPGVWGGEHVRVEVTDGGATINFDCAHAAVDGRIDVDGAGRFSAAGTFYREHGGPVREGEEARGEPMRITGRVGGSLMSLTVTRGRTRVGVYNLTRDSEGRLFKCR
jgi:hypothetical protein